MSLAAILIAPSVRAQDAATRIQQVMASPSTLEKAQKAGKKAAFFCANCHGETGSSVYDYIPNLAGQNPVYLLTQIQKFGDGRRQDEFMSGLIRVLKEEDRFNMAIYYANQPVQAAKPANAGLVAKGQQLYGQACKSCHGDKGYGGQNIARLAGQHPVYTTQSLEKYRKGAKERSDPAMSSIARRLKDADIAALANYIVTMK